MSAFGKVRAVLSKRNLFASSSEQGAPWRTSKRQSLLAASLLGLQVNQYRILRELGKGGEAEVFFVTDLDTNEPRVFRVIEGISLTFLGDEEGKETRRASLKARSRINALKTELAILKKVDHPSLLRFYQVLDLQTFDRNVQAISIVVEFVNGDPIISDDTLLVMDAAFWQNGGKRSKSVFSYKECAAYFAQLVAGLEYLHHNGIVHGDIKPANVLLNQATKQIKIIDFGVSRILSQGEEAEDRSSSQFRCHGGFGRGTLAFFSPESVQRDSKKLYCGKQADMWAAGMTLYALLYGHLPFQGFRDREKILELLEAEEPFPVPKPSTFSVPSTKLAFEFVTKMLAKDPSNRLCDVREIVKHPWFVPVSKTYEKHNQGLEHAQSLRDLLTNDEVEHVAHPISFATSWESFVEAFSKAGSTLGSWEASIESALSTSAEGAEKLAKEAIKLSSNSFEMVAESFNETLQETKMATERIKRHSFEIVDNAAEALQHMRFGSM